MFGNLLNKTVLRIMYLCPLMFLIMGQYILSTELIFFAKIDKLSDNPNEFIFQNTTWDEQSLIKGIVLPEYLLPGTPCYIMVVIMFINAFFAKYTMEYCRKWQNKKTAEEIETKYTEKSHKYNVRKYVDAL